MNGYFNTWSGEDTIATSILVVAKGAKTIEKTDVGCVIAVLPTRTLLDDRFLRPTAKVKCCSHYVPPRIGTIPGLQKLLHGGLQFENANCRLQTLRQVPNRAFGETIP